MIIAALVLLGLCFGSFVNALVWRVHEQASRKKKNKELSIWHGRSMCPHCKHTLSALDLIPVLSWLFLRGRCRYCHKPISVQYPLVELALPVLFVLSYAVWPANLLFGRASSLFHPGVWYINAYFALWLVILIGFLALTIYDLCWQLLPNRIVYPLTVLAFLTAIITVAASSQHVHALWQEVWAVVVGGGIFYLLFQLSGGKWIGGGDVRLGWLIGLIVATPAKSLLCIFTAGVAGSLVSLPLLATKKLKRTSIIPFGPFLMLGAVIAVLWGSQILDWYNHQLLGLN
ncbi:MAG TPA: prepilin peptidase [Candidatus Saccharimonadales bacterium]|nr:prepilin peptidase [Candidatus Saccharimonadales bacterium]